jgi:hypothetical protein
MNSPSRCHAASEDGDAGGVAATGKTMSGFITHAVGWWCARSLRQTRHVAAIRVNGYRQGIEESRHALEAGSKSDNGDRLWAGGIREGVKILTATGRARAGSGLVISQGKLESRQVCAKGNLVRVRVLSFILSHFYNTKFIFIALNSYY